MKRSKTTALLLMSASPLLFSACQPQPQAREGLYTSVEACAAQTHDIATCQQAFKQAQQQAAAQAPKYPSREACAQDWPPQQCAEQRDGQGHSFIGPLMTGFFLSQMLNNRAGFSAGPAFQDRDQQWVRPAPGAAGASAATVRGGQPMSRIGYTPNRAVTVSRGGFGGSTRGFGG